MLRLLSLAFALLCVDAISFTGNVERDFDPSKQETLIARAITNDANFGPNGEASPDVGVPPAWPYPSRENPLSGWDIKDVRLAYNYQTDELHVGINCFEICGDADADGDANRASVELASRGGNDLADFSNSESIAFAFDVDSDGQMDYVLGYPSEQNDASERYPCADTLDVSCFGLYRYDQRPGTAVPSQRFVYRAGDAFAAVDHNAAVSAARPDLEWTVRGYNALREAHGLVPLASNGGTEWALNFVAFAGSFQDDGVGEDQLPNNAPFATAEFGCANVDACDICGGDDSTCLDCAGIPNGPNVYDVCDVCGGDGRSCADCAGVPHGAAVYDECDVCNGPGADLCGVCFGDNSPDCAGEPCGSAVVDVCGVCNGDGTTCAPERGVCSEEFGNVCKLHPGDVWTGAYRPSEFNTLLAGAPVQFTLAPDNYAMETNALGTHWNRLVITDSYLAVQEFAAAPDRVQRDCAPDDVAKYALKFAPDCRRVQLEAIVEPCRRREALYNGVELVLAKPAPVATARAECDAAQGSGIWQAKYRARHSAQTGARQVGTFTFAPFNRAVVESSASAVYFYTWRDETRADDAGPRVRLVDVGSQDFAQTCGARSSAAVDVAARVRGDAGGVYRLDYGAECARLRISWPAADAPLDACVQRAERLDELLLLRVPLPSVKNAADACYTACAARLASADEVDECADRCRKFDGERK
eukprot:TRINITY_DN741_c0_g2_i3.p1 TRINITY_DN741_c0_g2~~TRINITY_DN741_c0_g2_i3.p1  ORF type:complete len:703 (+),score=516.55 TRINITY_DN741_c0_g2_i3:56-2164(+)